MNLNQLQYLIELDKSKSMNKAAEKLYITQPALRAAISALEQELGTPLVMRSNRGTVLTSFGEKVVEESKIILEYVNGWKSYNTDFDEDIHISCFANACGTIFSNFLLKINQDYPLLNIFLHSESALKSIDAIQNNQAQLALIMADADDEKIIKQKIASPNWKLSKVYEDRFSLFVNKNCSLLSQEITAEILSKYTFITFSNLEMLYNEKYRIRKEGFDKNKTIYINHNSDIFRILMQSISSFAILSNIFSVNNPYIESGNIVSIETEIIPWTVNHYLIEPIDAFYDPVRRTISDAIRAEYYNIEKIALK